MSEKCSPCFATWIIFFLRTTFHRQMSLVATGCKFRVAYLYLAAASRGPRIPIPEHLHSGVQSICRKDFKIKKFLYYTTSMCLSNSIPTPSKISKQEITIFHKRNKKVLYSFFPPNFDKNFTPQSYKWNNTQLHKINQYIFILKVQELSRRFPTLVLDEPDEFVELDPTVPSPR